MTNGTRYNEGDNVLLNYDKKVKVIHIIDPQSDSPDYVVQGEDTDGTVTVKASDLMKIDRSDWKSKALHDLEQKTGFKLEKHSTDARGSTRGNVFSAVAVDGSAEFEIFKDYQSADAVAKARLEEDIQMNHNIVKDWVLEDAVYITKTDKRMLADDERRHIREMLREDGVEGEELEERTEERVERFKNGLENPIQYFVEERGLYSKETLMEQDFIRVDYREAAETVVQHDGAANSLAIYDGTSIDLEEGVAFRIN